MKGPAEIVHGPALIGDIINVLLFGIMIAQTYIYFTNYSDRMWMRLMVLVVFIVDIVNTILNLMFIYGVLIQNFGNFEALASTNWTSVGDPATTGIIGLIVQLFFAWRIYALTRNWIMVSVVAAFACTGAIGAFIVSHEILIIPEFARFQEFKGYVIMWLACASAADIIITASLVWFLQKHKTGFKSSDIMVDRIIRVTMQTGLLTSTIAIIDLIVFLTDPTGTHLVFNITLCKLYSNSLVSSLNSRGGWKYDSSNRGSSSIGTFVARHTPSHPSDTMESGWREYTNSSRNPVGKLVNLIDSKRQETSTGSSEVFVHVESHEMG
ncbi:hypothetical protein P691DRAFT_773400, partial [Macrolepiota fuliginosa MF-IS2]